jgi:signal transduction histidine kinase
MMDNGEEHIGEPDFQQDLIKSIRGTVAKMNALIIKLKAFPQKQELRTEAADLALLARGTLEGVRKLKPSISFEAECAPAEARVDVQEMSKVVLNLLLNAGDAVGEQGRVVLRTGSRNGEIFLSVEDDGCGMSQTFVENHLFRPFRTTKEKGLGIGLYQCKQIVEAHGGRIEAESREGEGTVITVVMPSCRGREGRL